MRVETAQCRHGTFAFYDDDEYVGRSLALYGEYSEDEVALLRKCLRNGDVALDVGANIGALTVPMAKFVGEDGRVIAFEPQPENAELLERNLRANECGNVEVHEAAAGDGVVRMMRVPKLGALDHANYGRVEVGSGDVVVTVETIDDLKLDNVKFIKIDVEGHELDVLRGARETITKHGPILYVECDREEKAPALIAYLIDLGYRLYWHRPSLYLPSNFRDKKENVFGGIVSINILAVHEESGIKVVRLDEVADLRLDPIMYERELARYRRYLARDTYDLGARLLIAHYCNLMQREDEAEAALKENLAIDPDHFASRAILGLMQLRRGDFANGWQGYELRYHQNNTAMFGNRPHDGERWDGKPTDKPLLIWSEQGFGDSIMFVRFMADVLKVAPNAFLEIQPELFELVEVSGIVPKGRLYRRGRTLPHYDYHCSIPSLPATLGLGGDLARPPYLHAEPAMLKVWHGRPHPKVGLCSRGSAISERPYTRDIPHDLLAPITHRRLILNLNHDGQFESFADTAAAISALDLVITVDTSVAHLAGALGVPVWLLLSFDPDWRWGLRDTRTIWYPSMRIFRQPSLLDWASVVAEVRRELDALEAPYRKVA